MSQISKCPRVTVILSYQEASGEVSKLRYKSLLYFSSKRSYCNILAEHIDCADFVALPVKNLAGDDAMVAMLLEQLRQRCEIAANLSKPLGSRNVMMFFTSHRISSPGIEVCGTGGVWLSLFLCFCLCLSL